MSIRPRRGGGAMSSSAEGYTSLERSDTGEQTEGADRMSPSPTHALMQN